MYPIPGHVAMSIAGSCLTKLPYAPAIVATIAPDVVDKFLKDILDIVPYGRCWMHTLFAVAVCSLIVYWWKGKEWAFSWCLGHVLHLIGDIGFIPWFYPFIAYNWPDAPNVTLAAATGIKETFEQVMPSSIIGDATGTVSSQGGVYSDLVAQVFKLRLMMLEGVLMGVSIGLIYIDPKKYLKCYWTLVSVFAVFVFLRLSYDFPHFIAFLSQYLGNWVYI